MKTKIPTLALFAFLFTSIFFAQDVTNVKAKNSDISDNLDLRAVASIFGDAANLEDFERRLNNPKEQISNLDLNNDGNVDYLRVIESVEGRMHLIIIQAVLEKDVFQDVATIDVDRDDNNNVQVQVVGDVYMYGQNYIYEPVYVSRPIIYNTFWIDSYRPYYSPWYYGYYPVYFSYWNPYPVFRYRRNVNVFINISNNYNYVNYRRNQRAVALYSDRRSNGYERMNPNRSFSQRNNNVVNRYELDKTRNQGPRNNAVRDNSNPRNGNAPRNTTTVKGNNTIRNNSPSENVNPKSQVQPVRNNENVIRSNSPRESVNPRNEVQPRANSRKDITPRPRENSSPRVENKTNNPNPNPRSENGNGRKRN